MCERIAAGMPASSCETDPLFFDWQLWCVFVPSLSRQMIAFDRIKKVRDGVRVGFSGAHWELWELQVDTREDGAVRKRLAPQLFL
jgi:hypothetical protein